MRFLTQGKLGITPGIAHQLQIQTYKYEAFITTNAQHISSANTVVMYRIRRKPTFRSQTSLAPKVTQEDLKPVVEWTEDQSNRILIIHLPGFKREEIRVQLDSAGKLLIKGARQVNNKYINVNLSFDVPNDTINEKTGERFENECLTLIMPKKVAKEGVTGKEKTISEEKWKEPIPYQKPNSAEAKKGEGDIEKDVKTMEDKKGEEKKYEPTSDDKPTTTEATENEPTQKATPKGIEDSKVETIQNLNSKTKGENKEDGRNRDEKMDRGEQKKDEPVEKVESVEEKKKEDPLQALMKAEERGKEEKIIQKMKTRVMEICADKPKAIIKKLSSWIGSENSHGSLDGILEKMNRNRKVIAVAVMAFSAGFYVSRKLKTSGR